MGNELLRPSELLVGEMNGSVLLGGRCQKNWSEDTFPFYKFRRAGLRNVSGKYALIGVHVLGVK